VDRFTLIEEPGQLADEQGRLDASLRWSLDTEFVRERTYLPNLCLVQVAVGSRILLLDVLSLGNPETLRALLDLPEKPVVVHAAHQDIEALLPLTGAPLAPLFDTQLAAALLGFPSQVGYGELVRRVMGVELAKAHARTDWTKRPLSEAQLAYAADDVRYLGPLSEELERRLDSAGRLPWIAEECAALADPALYRVEPEEAWKRLKGMERLRPEERAVAHALAIWREERAQRRNLPRGWVLPDAALRELARMRPRSPAELQHVTSLPGGAASRLADELLQVVATAPRDADLVAAHPVVERLAPAQQAALRRLQALVQETATELGLEPEVLATRRDLTALVRGARDAQPLTGWRRDVVGAKLLAAI
jgi:ribonuclease D